jgi:hypothetical protein
MRPLCKNCRSRIAVHGDLCKWCMPQEQKNELNDGGDLSSDVTESERIEIRTDFRYSGSQQSSPNNRWSTPNAAAVRNKPPMLSELLMPAASRMTQGFTRLKLA